MTFEKILIAGLGLLGGSLAMKLRGSGIRRLGWARRAEVRDLALKLSAVDEVFADPAEAMKQADLVILCLPVPVIPVSPEIALSPAGAVNFSDALLMVSSVADALKNVPAAENPVLSAIAQAGFQAGKDLFLTPLDGTLENSFPENVRDSVCQNAEILCPGGESVTALFDKAEKIRASGRFILLAEKTGALADAALADLAVALHAARIRADGSGGIVCFNRLLQMEEMLGGQRRYGA